MNFNYTNIIQTCFESIQDLGLTSLVYYSHIPAALVALFLGFFIYLNNKQITAKIILLISFVFATWSFIDIILWISLDSQKYVFFWSLAVILEALIFIFAIYFINVFALGRDVKITYKVIPFLILLPIFLLASTKYNIGYFNMVECVPIDNILYPTYFLPLIAVLSILLIINFIYLLKKIDKTKKIQLSLIASSLFIFLFSFFASNYVASYFIENGILSYVDGYKIEMYSLFLMPVFLAVLTFIIVRFKTFNIKLLGAQALVWALIILVGSQFLYMQNMPTSALVLAGVTLVFSALIGLLVVRSVKKVDEQRELLDIANRNQESLLHFVTHQVKGYLAKSRNIFDGMVAGDYDLISDKAREMAKAGFDSDTKGVETVMAILKASDLKTGKTAFTKEKINLSALVAEIIESKKDGAIQKGLELSFEIEPNLEVEVDKLQIQEVFKNLITNSILYTLKGTVHVVLKKENNQVKFAVVDTGVGLSEKDKAKLFTEGGKGEQSSLVNVDSTGYGLYIAKQIVDEHNGTIGAHSEGKDKGSEFFVLLPIVG